MSGVGVVKWFEAVPTCRPTPGARDRADIVVEKRGEEFATEVMAFFREQLDVATPMWDSPVQGFAIDQLTLALERILTKQGAPQAVLAEAQQACQAELENVLASQG